MWAEVNGERKKVACGPCIRGHRSSKCDHRDRVLVEVRKPGRPLSSCPHPSGSCSCERVVINYTIPKSSECACPSERAQPTATVAGNSRIQKNRRRSTAINPSALEKAIRAGQDAETDTSSITRTPTDRSGSNDGSPLSSASSTPRLLPAQRDGASSSCKLNSTQPLLRQSSCCNNEAEPLPEPASAPVKSCCSGSKPQLNALPVNQTNMYQQFNRSFPYPAQPQMQIPQYQSFQSDASSLGQLPFGLGAPIYNHAAAAYQLHNMVSTSQVVERPLTAHGSHVNQHVPEHNCHCGESCSCFGCAAHPNNATMMEYVRLMAEFQYSGTFGSMSPPLYDMPTYPHHPGYGAEAAQTVNFSAMPQAMSPSAPTQMSFPANLNMPIFPRAPLAVSAPWQQTPRPVTTAHEPQYLEPSKYAVPEQSDDQGSLKKEETVSTPVADSPSDGKDEDTPTLSPSTFFWNQMIMPNCNDATGTCQCGDGCACVGCLTHGGHNGVPLETPAISEHDTFPDFPTDAGLTLDDPNNYMGFHSTPI